MPTRELLRFVVWVQLVKHAFLATAPLGVVGLVVWLGQDRRRLTHPFLLVPMLFLGGYVALSLRVPFVPFFRFFWPVQVFFLGFVVYGTVEIARRVAPEHHALRVGVAAALLFFLVDDLVTRQLHYRHQFAEPFQQAMAFVEDVQPTILQERHPGESVLTPLVSVPGPDAIQPGRDGVVLRVGERSAVFLPQVAAEQGWSRLELLDNLALKAGLAPGAWRDKRAALLTFRADVFDESSLK